jgi:hypothetical protein
VFCPAIAVGSVRLHINPEALGVGRGGSGLVRIDINIDGLIERLCCVDARAKKTVRP